MRMLEQERPVICIPDMTTGIFRQGVFELHGCRVVWPESLW